MIPASRVEDDYCDCPDGADEVKTSACAGLVPNVVATTFECTRFAEDVEPLKLFSSRVGDGVCDCCDGADEMPLGEGEGEGEGEGGEGDTVGVHDAAAGSGGGDGGGNWAASLLAAVRGMGKEGSSSVKCPNRCAQVRF